MVGRGKVLRQLQELGAAKSAIMTDDDLTEDEKAEKVKRPVYFFVKTIIFTKKILYPTRSSKIVLDRRKV